MKRILKSAFVVVLSVVVLTTSSSIAGDTTARARRYTQSTEFDFVSWTIDALFGKIAQGALNFPAFLTPDQQHQLVLSYLGLVEQRNQVRAKIDRIYANPSVKDPETQSAFLQGQLNDLDSLQKRLSPLVESILQDQVSATLSDLGIAVSGQPLPPVIYHVTELPEALIVSPRNTIRQDADISLNPGMTTAEITELEKRVESNLNVSALVVPVGGIGIYPPMVMSTTNLPWLIEVIAHEWTHNYLTLHPLGLNYETTPELRSINETVASISGTEISEAVLGRYYPEFIQGEVSSGSNQSSAGTTTNVSVRPVFDYNNEMHTTRVNADRLLAEGKIEAAEQYMENQRQIFWDHGYQIRRLNQAYFAFYGAYADVPGGAAGTDPVGPAVRALRARSQSLAGFLANIAQVTSFSQLQSMVQ